MATAQPAICPSSASPRSLVSDLPARTRLPLGGQVIELEQPQRGYRFNVDSVHLIEFAREGRAVEALCDLGAGSGVVGLGLLALGAAKAGTFIELDPEQASRCLRNLHHNQLHGEVLCGDITALDARPRAGLVVCNPPYFAPDEGRAPLDPQRRRARIGTLTDFARAAARACGPRGRVCFVYPAPHAMRLLEALRRSGLQPKRLQFVHTSTLLDARLVLVEAKVGKPGGLRVQPPRFDPKRGR